jgi:hypothetical protein
LRKDSNSNEKEVEFTKIELRMIFLGRGRQQNVEEHWAWILI